MATKSVYIPEHLKELWAALSYRHRQFILLFLATGKVTQSYVDAGFPEKTAYVNASIVLHSPHVWRVLYGILKAHHLTPEYADIKLKAQLEATETKFFSHNGVVMDSRELINWTARDAALDKLLRLQGRYKQLDGQTDVNVNVSVSMIDGLKQVIERRQHPATSPTTNGQGSNGASATR